MINIETIKSIVLNDQKFTSDFANFVAIQLTRLGESSLNLTVSQLLLSYCSREMSISKLHSVLKNADNDFLDKLLLKKDFPDFKDYLSCIPNTEKDKDTFNIIKGLIILNNYGKSKTIGVNDKHIQYLRKLKAEKQSINLIRKDLNGLLGATNQFKKEFDPKNSKRKSNSIWTVKK